MCLCASLWVYVSHGQCAQSVDIGYDERVSIYLPYDEMGGGIWTRSDDRDVCVCDVRRPLFFFCVLLMCVPCGSCVCACVCG